MTEDALKSERIKDFLLHYRIMLSLLPSNYGNKFIWKVPNVSWIIFSKYFKVYEYGIAIFYALKYLILAELCYTPLF